MTRKNWTFCSNFKNVWASWHCHLSMVIFHLSHYWNKSVLKKAKIITCQLVIPSLLDAFTWTKWDAFLVDQFTYYEVTEVEEHFSNYILKNWVFFVWFCENVPIHLSWKHGFNFKTASRAQSQRNQRARQQKREPRARGLALKKGLVISFIICGHHSSFALHLCFCFESTILFLSSCKIKA